jgi:hypothetical protein
VERDIDDMSDRETARVAQYVSTEAMKRGRRPDDP